MPPSTAGRRRHRLGRDRQRPALRRSATRRGLPLGSGGGVRRWTGETATASWSGGRGGGADRNDGRRCRRGSTGHRWVARWTRRRAGRSQGTGSMSDEARAADLRRMKLVAASLLVLAAIIFVAAKSPEGDGAWGGWGYVRATAEAAMVGALGRLVRRDRPVPAPAADPDSPHRHRPSTQGPDRGQPRWVRRGQLPDQVGGDRAPRGRRPGRTAGRLAGPAGQRPHGRGAERGGGAGPHRGSCPTRPSSTASRRWWSSGPGRCRSHP